MWDGSHFVAVDDEGGKKRPRGMRIRVPEHQLMQHVIYEIFPPPSVQHSEDGFWIVGDARSDKVQPNNTTTVERTLRTIADRVRVEEICTPRA
jgi:hypothetical protein